MQKGNDANRGVAPELRGGFQRHLARFSVYWVDLEHRISGVWAVTAGVATT